MKKKREKGCCIHTFYTRGVLLPPRSPPLRVLVNGGNCVPGGLTQLGQGQGLGTGLGARSVDHPGLYSLLSLVGLFTCPT